MFREWVFGGCPFKIRKFCKPGKRHKSKEVPFLLRELVLIKWEFTSHLTHQNNFVVSAFAKKECPQFTFSSVYLWNHHFVVKTIVRFLIDIIVVIFWQINGKSEFILQYETIEQQHGDYHYLMNMTLITLACRKWNFLVMCKKFEINEYFTSSGLRLLGSSGT